MGAFMERNVSAIISRRASALRRGLAGPEATIHEHFICGRPQILLRPLRTKVRHGESAAAKVWGPGCEGVVEEDFVDDESEVVAEADVLECDALGGGGEVSGGVVGMHEEDGAGLWG